MREYRVVCAGAWGEQPSWPYETQTTPEDAQRQVERYDRNHYGRDALGRGCGPHVIQFRDVPDWQDLEDEA